MKYNKPILFLLLSCGLFFGCEKDEVHRQKAEALSSFDGTWSFVDAKFAYENDGLLSISFDHINEDPLIVNEVLFKNIEPVEGTTMLVFEDGKSDLPTSKLFVINGGDVLSDSYIMDSTVSLESFITIDCISKNKITGQFQVNYIRAAGGQSHYGLPERFTLTDGKFDARR